MNKVRINYAPENEQGATSEDSPFVTIRAAYVKAYGRDSTLTDEELSELDGGEGLTVEQWVDAILDAETKDVTGPPDTGKDATRKELGASLALIANEDHNFTNDLQSVIDGDEKKKKIAFTLMLDTFGSLGIKGIERKGMFTREQLNNMPDIIDKTEVKEGRGGNNPCWYKTIVEGKPKWNDWYDVDLFANMTEGQKIQQALVNLDPASGIAPYKDWGKKELQGEKSVWLGRRRSGVAAIKRTMRFARALLFIKENMPAIDMEYLTVKDKDGTRRPARTDMPIIIGPADEMVSGSRNFTIGQVLSFDLSWAKDQGGSFADLLDSAKDENGGDESKDDDAEGGGIPLIKTVKQADTFSGHFASYAEECQSNRVKMGILLKELASNDGMVKSFWYMREFLTEDALTARLETRYSEITKKEQAASIPKTAKAG